MPTDEGPKSKPASPRKDEVARENRLDEALEETFPASDPISVGDVSHDPPEGRPVDRRPPEIDRELVRELARKSRKDDA